MKGKIREHLLGDGKCGVKTLLNPLRLRGRPVTHLSGDCSVRNVCECGTEWGGLD